MAGEGPKLTHLTASRPKVPRGRRPPKRYAVFHEDDSKPEVSVYSDTVSSTHQLHPLLQESPPDTPDLSKPSEPSPTSTPSPSESPATQRKKGHKPTVALLPNMNRAASVRTPKTPPLPPAKVAKADSEVNITVCTVLICVITNARKLKILDRMLAKINLLAVFLPLLHVACCHPHNILYYR